MKLTMNRKGEFTCNWVGTDGKCGVGSDTTPRYFYECHIETGDLLDSNGFIFDQLEIDQFFQERYTKLNLPNMKITTRFQPQSCEKIALTAVTEIKNMIEKHMFQHHGMSVIYRIAVTIKFGEAAMMTAEWVPEKAKQIANVKKLKSGGSNVRRVY